MAWHDGAGPVLAWRREPACVLFSDLVVVCTPERPAFPCFAALVVSTTLSPVKRLLAAPGLGG